jgi:hypothetical protein
MKKKIYHFTRFVFSLDFAICVGFIVVTIKLMLIYNVIANHMALYTIHFKIRILWEVNQESLFRLNTVFKNTYR